MFVYASRSERYTDGRKDDWRMEENKESTQAVGKGAYCWTISSGSLSNAVVIGSSSGIMRGGFSIEDRLAATASREAIRTVFRVGTLQ